MAVMSQDGPTRAFSFLGSSKQRYPGGWGLLILAFETVYMGDEFPVSETVK